MIHPLGIEQEKWSYFYIIYSMLQSGMSTIHKRSTFLTVLSFYFYITFLEDYCEDDKKS